jgi:hypothetical protein
MNKLYGHASQNKEESELCVLIYQRSPLLCAEAVYFRRNNNFDPEDWHTVMKSLEQITTITSFNDVDGLGGLFAGGATEAALRGKDVLKKEALEIVILLLLRNRDTLAKVDLR